MASSITWWVPRNPKGIVWANCYQWRPQCCLFPAPAKTSLVLYGVLWNKHQIFCHLLSSTAKTINVGSEGCFLGSLLRPENHLSSQVLSLAQTSGSASHHLLTLLGLNMRANREQIQWSCRSNLPPTLLSLFTELDMHIPHRKKELPFSPVGPSQGKLLALPPQKPFSTLRWSDAAERRSTDSSLGARGDACSSARSMNEHSATVTHSGKDSQREGLKTNRTQTKFSKTLLCLEWGKETVGFWLRIFELFGPTIL